MADSLLGSIEKSEIASGSGEVPEALAPAGRLGVVVARNAAYALGAQALLKVMGFAFSVFVVRSLGAAEFGRYAAVVAFVALFAFFTDWGLAPYMLRQIAREPAEAAWLLPTTISVRVVLALVVAVIAPGVAYLAGRDGATVRGVLLASAGLLIYAIHGPCEATLVALDRLDRVSVLTVLQQVVFWVLGGFLLLQGVGFLGLIAASLLGVTAATLWAVHTLRRLGLRWSRPVLGRWRELARGAWPFGLLSLADTITQRSGVLIMSFLLAEAAVGFYSVPLALIGMLLLSGQGIATAAYPAMVRGAAAEPEQLASVSNPVLKHLLALSLPLSVGGIVLGEPLLVALYGAEFAESAGVFRVMLAALPALFILELFGRQANAQRMERRAAKTDGLAAAITVALTIVLVPTLGVLGGGLAFLASRLFRLGAYVRLVGPVLPPHGKRGALGRTVLAALTMGGAVAWLATTLGRAGLDGRLPLLATTAAGAMLYGGLLVIGKVFGRDELAVVRTLLRRRRGAVRP